MRDGAGTRLRRDGIALVVLAAAYLVLAASVRNSYYQLMLTLVPIWAVMGLGWNLISGYSGLVSFGHAAFFGAGAYAVTLALVYWNLTPWLGIPLAMMVGALAAVLIGMPTFRLRGHYFALAMLAYPLAMLYVLEYLGFQEVPLPMHRAAPAAFLQFNDPRLYTVVAVGLLLAAMVASMLVENSRFGLALLAIRQNELAAEAAGIDTWRWKMLGLMASGTMAAAAGGLYACVLLIVTPDSVFGVLVSAQALIVALFGGLRALQGVSLTVAAGQFVTVVGPNGAGKTTLFKAICGVVPVAAGRVTFEGRDLLRLPASRRAHLGIAHVPEGRQVFKTLTVRENLEMGAYPPNGRARFHHTLERIHALFPILAERTTQLAGTLSGGEQQMLAIGRGLAAAPRLLMLDEPSMGLAPAVADLIFERIAQVHREDGLTILLVEQRVAEALELADRGYVLETGRIVLEGTYDRLLSDDRVRHAYLGLGT